MLAVLLAAITFSLTAQDFQSFVDYVNSLPNATAKMAAVDSFMNANPQLPHIYSDIATFVYRGTANSVSASGDFNQWNAQALTKIPETDLWYWSKSFELDARLDYRFVLNGTVEIKDPNNPFPYDYTASQWGSQLAMPDYLWPWELDEYPDVPKGTLEEFYITSTYSDSTYKVQVYLPNGYQTSGGDGYPTAYFNDGLFYSQGTNMFDNLIDSGLIQKIIAVFVYPYDRDIEYWGNGRVNHRLFFVNELVPYIDSVYNTSPKPEDRAVIGLSASGNISALIGYHHDDVFGKIGLQSGAFIYNNWETYNLITNGDKKEIHWAAIWGSYDLSWLYPNMRQFRDNLIAKGYPFYWRELHEGHSFGLFRATVDDILIEFFPPVINGSTEQGYTYAIEWSIFPNPTSGNVTIKFNQKTATEVTLKIFDLAGQEVATLLTGFQPAGVHQIEWSAEGIPAGVYFYTLRTDEFAGTGKLIISR